MTITLKTDPLLDVYDERSSDGDIFRYYQKSEQDPLLVADRIIAFLEENPFLMRTFYVDEGKPRLPVTISKNQWFVVNLSIGPEGVASFSKQDIASEEELREGLVDSFTGMQVCNPIQCCRGHILEQKPAKVWQEFHGSICPVCRDEIEDFRVDMDLQIRIAELTGSISAHPLEDVMQIVEECSMMQEQLQEMNYLLDKRIEEDLFYSRQLSILRKDTEEFNRIASALTREEVLFLDLLIRYGKRYGKKISIDSLYKFLGRAKEFGQSSGLFTMTSTFFTKVTVFYYIYLGIKKGRSKLSKRKNKIDPDMDLASWKRESKIEEYYQNIPLYPEKVIDDPVLNRYICPITGRPIRYPVKAVRCGILIDRRIYEESAITLWLAHKQESPVLPGVEMKVSDLKPCEDIERIISERLERLDAL